MKKELGLWDQFCKGCSSQWRAAGNKRFAYDGEKELSDVITDILGNSWIGGQLLKYAGEIWNTKRIDGAVPEVNFFKMTVYVFIWWLKEFKQRYTNPVLKEQYWPEFLEKIRKYYKEKLEIGSIKKEYFFAVVEVLKEKESKCNEAGLPKEEMFFEMGAEVYHWWIQEMGYFTNGNRDEGEEFEK